MGSGYPTRLHHPLEINTFVLPDDGDLLGPTNLPLIREGLDIFLLVTLYCSGFTAQGLCACAFMVLILPAFIVKLRCTIPYLCRTTSTG